MKKSQEISRKTWKMIAKNLIILAVMAVVAFVGVMSWFTQKSTATADGISAKTKMSEKLEFFIMPPSDDKTVNDQYDAINTWISTYNTTHSSDTGFVEKKWHTGELTFDFSDPEFKFMEDIFLCETTGNGSAFTIPKLIQYGNIAYVDTTADFETATPNNEYMSFDLYFRSTQQFDVALKSDTEISPSAAIDASTEDGMKNAAIGAVRLAVLNGSTRELLWIPAPRVWFDGTANQMEGTLHTNYTGNPTDTYKPGGNVTYNATNESVMLTNDATNEHWYFNTSKTRVKDNGSDVVASTNGDYQLGRDISVVRLSNYKQSDGYYFNRIRVNLWIEGEDAESRLKLVGGKFNMKLVFDQVEGS